MNRKARINYIHALSSQVERKKMYKAKKQWVVAGISFLVATGMGAIGGSHLTTHADTTNGNSQQTTSVAPKLVSGSASNVSNQKSTTNSVSSSANSNVKQPASSSVVEQQAKTLHNQVVNNNAQKPHFNSAYENYLKSNSQLVKLYNAGSTQSNNNVVTNKSNPVKNKPQVKATMLGNTKAASGFCYDNNLSNPAKWNLDNQGNLLIYDGNFNGLYSNMNGLDVANNVRTIRFNNATLVGGLLGSLYNDQNLQKVDFTGLNTNGAYNFNSMFASDHNLQYVNFGNIDTSHVDDMSSFFRNNHSLTTIIGLSDINTSSVRDFNDMFQNDNKLTSLNLSKFDTYSARQNAHSGNGGNGLSNFISGCKNLHNITLGPKTVLTPAAINGSGAGSTALSADGSPFLLADGTNSQTTNNHQGSWTLLQGIQSTGKWGTNSSDANVFLTKNGYLYIINGKISSNRNEAKDNNGKGSTIDWNSVKHIYTKDVTVPNNITGLFSIEHDNNQSPYSIDLNGIQNISDVSDMSQLFANDRQLTSVSLPQNADSKLNNIDNMFAGDWNIRDIEFPNNWNLSNVSMNSLFDSDRNLQTLVLPNKFKNTQHNNFVFGAGSGSWLSDLSTLVLSSDDRLADTNLMPSTWINLDSTNPQSVNSSDLEKDGNHKGTWSRNAEIINLQYAGNTVYSNLVKGSFNTSNIIENTPLFVPMEYKLDNPNQSFTYNGGVTNVSVHLAASDAINNASSLVNSDHIKTSYLASYNSNDGSFAKNQVNAMKADLGLISDEITSLNTDRANETASNVDTIISNANATYDSAYEANAAIESMMNTSLTSESNEISSVSSSASSSAASAETAASESASSNADSFASALNEALTSGKYSNSGLTSFESSAVSDVAKDYSSLSSASSNAQSGSSQASITSIFVSDLGNALSGSSYSHNSSLNAQENAIISSVATDYSNWNAGSSKATNNGTSLSNLFNSNSSASSTVATVANSVASSYAQSLTASSSNSTTTISGIASSVANGLISSLFNSSNSNGSYSTSTIDSVASFFASSLSGTLSGIYAQSASVTHNSTAIKNLQSKAAITFTFTGSNSNTIPVTMTNGYIESNAQSHNGNTYDITNLLDEDVASGGKHVVGDYTVTLGTDNAGNATLKYNPQANVGMMPPNFKANHSFMLDKTASAPKVPASTNTAHDVVLANNQAEYTGTITLNFGSHQAKLTFDTGSTNPKVLASDTVNLLNYAKNAQNPSDFTKDNLIKNFDTTGYKFDSATSTPNNQYNFTIQPSDATNQSGADVHSNYNITLNYTAQPVTENIQYVYGTHVENKQGTTTTTTGADDLQGNWKDTNNLKSGWQLANGTSNPFTFTNNGTVKVNVTPVQTTDTINYVDQKGNQVGSQTFTGNNYQASDAGDNRFNVDDTTDTKLDKNYKLKTASTPFKYDGGTYTVSVIGNARSPENTIPSDTKPSDANNPKSNQSMTKPTGDSDVLFTINVRDYNADGTKEINYYTKYATESGEVGDPFTIKASDYLTNGFNINTSKSKDSDVKGTISDTRLNPSSVTFNYYAKASNFDPNKAKTDPNYVKNYNADPTTPKPISVEYIGELNGKANQVVQSDNNVITGNTGDTGTLSNIESAAPVPKGYIVNGTKYGYTITTAPQTIKVYLNSKTAKQMNNNGKPYTPSTPSNNSSSKVPSDNTIKKDASHGFATVIINENINGKLAHQSAQTVDESNLGVGTDYTIEPTSFTPTGYQVDSKDQALTGTINPDGSLSNGSATFTYDVNDSEIAPITFTYYNQYGDLVDVNSGKSKLTGDNDVTNSDATVTIQPAQLATKGAIGDYVDITGFLTAPKGHHFNKTILDSSNNNLDHVQLQKAKGNNPVHLGLAVFEDEPKSNSNSAKPSSFAAQVNMNSDQLSSLASEIGSNITIRPNVSETDEVVDNSALTSLASEVVTNNQEISNLANKPTSAASTSINYDYFNNLVNNGVSKLTNAINKDFKANISNVHAQPVKPRKTVGKRTYSYLKWLRVVKPLKLYNNNHEAVKVIKPRHRITLNVKAAYKVHNHIVFKVSYKHHNYFIKANNKAIKNAYLPASHKLIGRRVRVLYNVYANKHKTSGRVKTLHKGYKSTIKHIMRIGNHNVTRIQLADGLWISANMNYVEVL